MTADTPTPYTPPDGVILTTMAEVRRIGHGQVIYPEEGHLGIAPWLDPEDSGLIDEVLVWWRPAPEPTVTIELTRTELRNLSETPDVGGSELAKIEAALARLDGDT